ncbi:MAG: GGDEF domain-containing protein [Gammaproteobacteria bacterium]|nr:diguanylate cyclase [Gammaproteobacteria bacterium]NIN62055.1 diguanylate cyclase [Gammaproteobacteria bacterium]NIO62134.1 diguanylate cyclase [Gammaproteobacteria bacterium]NIQ08256.1 GGDEF domain-containing protein [Gammaproteobacteria bacterium]NIQ19846.1 diguanylate cyclase [Gammaproteobacteria bacterium]
MYFITKRIQQFLPALIVITLLMTPAVLMVNNWMSLPTWLTGSLNWLPYLIMVLALMLCVVFYNSREFCLFLTMLCIYILLQTLFWPETKDINKTTLYNLIGLVLALNFVLFNFMKERGLLNSHGGNKLFILSIEFLACFWLIKSKQAALASFLALGFIPEPDFINKLAGSPLLLVWMASLVLFAIHQNINPGLLRGAWGLALLGLIIGLNFTGEPIITSIYFVISSLILITAIIIHAYHLAYRDELTQLPSRRALKQQLLSLGRDYSIAMVDVDHFKKLNDTYGHDVGDDVLKMLAMQLRTVAGGGRPFRYGGEEFTLVFPNTEASEASLYLDVLREKIANKKLAIRHQGRPRKKPQNRKRRGKAKDINISISVGLAEKTDKHRSPQDVIKAADNALYKAKEGGRNRVVVAKQR